MALPNHTETGNPTPGYIAAGQLPFGETPVPAEYRRASSRYMNGEIKPGYGAVDLTTVISGVVGILTGANGNRK